MSFAWPAPGHCFKVSWLPTLPEVDIKLYPEVHITKMHGGDDLLPFKNKVKCAGTPLGGQHLLG